jgi:hypothetical protein
MKNVLLTVIILFSLTTNIIYAQNTDSIYTQNDDVSLSLFGGISIPTGDFGANIGENPVITRRYGFDVGDNVGLASTGFCFGAELVSSTGIKGLSWLVNATFISNSTDASTVTSEFEKQLGDTVTVSFDFGNWLNIPVMTGVIYKYTFSPRISVFGTAQLGINFSQAPSKTVKVDGITGEEKTYGLVVDFGYGIGLGAILWGNYTLGVKYLNLDTPTYPVTLKLSEKVFPEIVTREREILGEDRSVSMVLVTLGINIL